MRVIILLNGEPHRGKIEAEGAYVLCCDGAYRWAKGNVHIDENLGDFDSLDEVPTPAPLKIYPSEKDETDGELAVDRALKLGASEILIFGGGGRREDHFLGNLHLLYKAATLNIPATLITNGAAISLAKEGEQKFVCKKGQTVSLLPFGGDAHIMKLRGLKYAPEDVWLCYGTTRGISNLTTDEGSFSLYVERGHVLVIVNEEEI